MKYFFVFLFALTFTISEGQKRDSLPHRLNTIKLNLVSRWLYSNSYVFSYERITKPNQSFAVMGGVVNFPSIADFGSSIKVKEERKKKGYVYGGEYRFYLQKENKFAAPHGVFVGPYVNYFHFSNDRTLVYTPPGNTTTSSALMTMDLNVLNIGAQLGYQFVIKDRWTIDLVFIGPSISNYSVKLKVNGDFDVSEQDILESEILSALVNRFPLIGDLLTDQSVKVQGKTQQWAGGFRYQANVGYHFGRKNKKK